MARRNTRTEKAKRCKQRQQHKAAAQNRDIGIDLLKTIQLLHEYLSESLCQEVFQRARTTERQRE